MLLQTSKTFDRLALAWQPRFKILQGGSSSGKTYSILQYLITLALKSKKNKLISIVAETLPALRRGALRDFINILGTSYDRRMHNKSEGTYKLGSWVFEFFGADNSSRLRGARRNILFINECNNVKYDAYAQLEMRTSDKVFLDFNPTQSFWAHEELVPSLKDNEYFFDVSTYKDNNFVPKNVIDSIERRKYDSYGNITEYYKVYGLGQIGSLEDVIFDNWTQITEIPHNVSCVFGLDFGFSVDPATLVRVGIVNKNVYVDEVFYETELTNQDIISRLNNYKGIASNRDMIYADSAEPKSIKEISKGGYMIRGAIKGPDSIRAGIDWLKARDIKVTQKSIHLIKEFRNYTWMKDNDGKVIPKPIDNFCHCIDALRYACSPHIRNTRVIAKKMRL